MRSNPDKFSTDTHSFMISLETARTSEEAK